MVLDPDGQRARAESAFKQACLDAGIPENTHQELWSKVLDYYSSPTHAWHTLAHPLAMYDFVKRAEKSGLTIHRCDPALMLAEPDSNNCSPQLLDCGSDFDRKVIRSGPPTWTMDLTLVG